MKKTADQVLWYRGEFGAQSSCRVRVYRPSAEEREAGRLDVVIVSELEDNPGTELSLGAETVAARLWKKLRRPEAGFIYIEHALAKPGAGETFEEVTFQTGIPAGSPYVRPASEELFTPFWSKLTREQVEDLISVALEEDEGEQTGQ